MTGNSTRKPPAWGTPRLTASASPRRWTVQLTSSLQLLQMPSTARPRNVPFVAPVALSHDRCRNPSRAHRRERLVEKEGLGAGVHGARDRDRLALAAREHRHLGADGTKRADADVVDVPACPLAHLAVVQPPERPPAPDDLALEEHVVV